MNILSSDFFDRSTTDVAHDLLGKFLIREYDGHHWTLMITEVEAYDGPDDKASHAHKGRTDRTEPMFANAGTMYVYLVYGMHWMLNIVTGPKDYPAAILIRSALVMLPTGEIEHIDGPAKLTKFLRIGSEFNGLEATEENHIWLEDRDIAIPKEHIIEKKRVGVDYAAEWKDALYNFSIEIVRHGEA
jgi:DNA-3-methyladenine glycosylase